MYKTTYQRSRVQVNFFLQQAMKASRSIALLFLEIRRQMGLVVNATARPLCPRGKDAVHVTQEAGRAPGTVWTPAENLAPTGIRSPDRPTRSN